MIQVILPYILAYLPIFVAILGIIGTLSLGGILATGSYSIAKQILTNADIVFSIIVATILLYALGSEKIKKAQETRSGKVIFAFLILAVAMLYYRAIDTTYSIIKINSEPCNPFEEASCYYPSQGTVKTTSLPLMLVTGQLSSREVYWGQAFRYKVIWEMNKPTDTYSGLESYVDACLKEAKFYEITKTCNYKFMFTVNAFSHMPGTYKDSRIPDCTGTAPMFASHVAHTDINCWVTALKISSVPTIYKVRTVCDYYDPIKKKYIWYCTGYRCEAKEKEIKEKNPNVETHVVKDLNDFKVALEGSWAIPWGVPTSKQLETICVGTNARCANDPAYGYQYTCDRYYFLAAAVDKQTNKAIDTARIDFWVYGVKKKEELKEEEKDDYVCQGDLCYEKVSWLDKLKHATQSTGTSTKGLDDKKDWMMILLLVAIGVALGDPIIAVVLLLGWFLIGGKIF